MSRSNPQPESAVFPASPEQERFWFLDRLGPNRADTTMALRFDIRGEVPSSQLEAALQGVVARHEILRTRFLDQDGMPVQHVLDHVDLRLGRVDIRTLPIDDHETRIAAIERKLAADPFDLAAPPLFRATHVRTAPKRAALLIAVHHCVFDGASAAAFAAELTERIAASLARRPVDLADLPLQYADYALWRHACRDSQAHADDLRFWSETLSGAPYFSLPADRDGMPQPSSFRRSLPTGLGRRLEDAAKRAGVTPFMLSAAAVSAALARLAGTGEALLATPVAGRGDPDLDPMIGVFVNTVILRIPALSDGSFTSHLARTRQAVERTLSHQSAPFEEVLSAANPSRARGQTPLTSVCFGFHGGLRQDWDGGEFQITRMPTHSPGILYDLNIDIVATATGWAIDVDYDAGKYGEDRVAALCEAVEAAFEGLLDAPNSTLSTVAGPVPAFCDQKEPRVPDHTARPPAQPPVTDAKAQIAAIWSEILDQPNAECDGDFFALGGHSILALRMLARVADRLGVSVQVGDFLQDPTLEGLASQVALRGAAPADLPSTWCVTLLKAGTVDGPVIVTVNQPFLYHALAHAFAPETSVVSLTVPDRAALDRQAGQDGATIAADAAAMIAARYAARDVVLVGHCADALTALAIAQALDAAQEPARMVAMIDAWAPTVRGTSSLSRLARAQRARLLRWGHYAAAWAGGRIGWREFLRRIGPVLRLMQRTGIEPQPSAGEVFAHAVNACHQSAWEAHRFDPWPGEALLFATASQPRSAERCLFGWRDVLSEDSTLVRLDGWHEDALTDAGFERIAQVIELRLSRRSPVQSP